MTELHLDPAARRAFGSRTATVDDAAETHVLGCSTCREGLADTVEERDLERSWTVLAHRLGLETPVGGAAAPPWKVDEPSLPVIGFEFGSIGTLPGDLDAPEMTHRRWRRPTLVAAAAVLVAAAVVMSTSDDSGERVASSGGPGWVDILPADSAVLDSAPPVAQVLAATAWNGGFVAVTANDGAAGTTAWVLDGDDWTRQGFDPPEGCDAAGGVAVTGDRLVLSCSGPERAVFVASTSDLVRWETHVVAHAGGSFGTGIGPGPGGGLTVTLLEALGQGNTTQGSTLRVWTSTDLEAWIEIPGADSDQLLDAAPQRIRSFGDTLVITGAHTEYPDGSGNAATWRPAMWVSRAGGPVTRIDATAEGTDADAGGWTVDVASTGTGYVAVGGTGTGSRPLAWTSTDLQTWVPASFSDDVTGSGMFWSVAREQGGTLLAAASTQADAGSVTWSSTDEGATWQIIGEGPDLLVHRDDDVVGARSGDRLRVQRWDSSADAPSASGTEDDAFVIDVGSLVDLEGAPDKVLVVPADGARHQIFVVRDGDDIIAMSARSPKQGCRLVFAADVLAENRDFLLGPDAFFHDPCHGANFDRTGNHTSGPSPRDMYRYDVEERDGRILVDTGLLRPGSWIAGIEQEDPPLVERGDTDAVAERWRTVVEDADSRRGTDPALPVVLVLGAFHEPSSGLVTVPFTFAGSVAHLSVGPPTVHPPDQDGRVAEVHPLEDGTVTVERVANARTGEIRLVTELADGQRLRIDIRWGFENDPVPDLVSFIDSITRTVP